MADKYSIELLSTRFAYGTCAYKRMVKSPNRLLSAFTSFVRESFEPVVKTESCAQYVDNLDNANHTTCTNRELKIDFFCELKKRD